MQVVLQLEAQRVEELAALDAFSQDRLMRYLRALGEDDGIRVSHPEEYESEGRLIVTIDQAAAL